LNGLSYLAVLAALLAMRLEPRASRPRTRLLQDLHGGLRYAFGFPPIRAILLLLALISLMASPFSVLMPLFVGDDLQGGSETLGFLMAASGLGALSAGVYLASRNTVLGLGTRMTLASAGLGGSLIAFTFARSLPLAVLIAFLTGFCMMVQMTASNTVLQTIVDDDKRGRVMSLYTMAFLGMAPFGNLLGGALAGTIGLLDALRVAGACCVGGALLFALQLPSLRQRVRPIYRERGILPAESAPIFGGSNQAMLPSR
jgi:MFS family permease